ncbi:MAG: hypothetical protein IJ093_00155, partial [Bacilli bacterium]|nr:hypothetical protein [Bacilli bacterium]
MNKEELDAFKKEYEKFYIERFIYGSAEVEAFSKEKRLNDMKRMYKAYCYLMDKNTKLNVNDVKVLGEMVNDDTVCPGFRRVDVIAGNKATFEPAPKTQIVSRLNDLFYNYYNIFIKKKKTN